MVKEKEEINLCACEDATVAITVETI